MSRPWHAAALSALLLALLWHTAVHAQALRDPCPEGYAYQCQGLACACAATQAVYAGTGTDPLDLIWDIAGGTANLAGETLEVTLGIAPLSADSACRARGRIEIIDPGPGNVLAASDVEIAPGGPILSVLEWANTGAATRRLGVQASLNASDCLIEDLRGAELLVATYATDTGQSTGPAQAAKPLLVVAEEVEGETLGRAPPPIRPAYAFPPWAGPE